MRAAVGGGGGGGGGGSAASAASAAAAAEGFPQNWRNHEHQYHNIVAPPPSVEGAHSHASCFLCQLLLLMSVLLLTPSCLFPRAISSSTGG